MDADGRLEGMKGPRASLRRSITRLEVIAAAFGVTILVAFSDHPNVRFVPAIIALALLVIFQQWLARLPGTGARFGPLDLRLPWVLLVLTVLCRFADPFTTPLYLTVAASGLFEAARNPTRWRLLTIPVVPVIAIAPALFARPGWMEPISRGDLVATLIGLPVLLVLGSMALAIALRERVDARAMVREQGRLRERQRQEATVLQAIDEPVLLLDHDFQVADCNPVAQDVLGAMLTDRPLSQLVTTPEGQDPVPVDSGELTRENFHAVESYLATGPNRGERWALDIRRLPLGGGERTQWVTVLHRSDRMLEQVQLREDRYRLLQHGSRRRYEFLRLMSHELRTPLNAVLGFTQLLQSREFGELTEIQEERLAVIQRSGSHLTRILDDVREFVHLGTTPEARREQFDLHEVTRSTVKLVASMAEQRSLTLDLRSPREEVIARGDEAMTSRALLNLLSNAIRFTPAGGRVRVFPRVLGGRVEVEIEDTGIGISWTDQAGVFEPLQRGRAEPGGEGGSGMGLPIARRLMELQGGSITLRSRPGQGSIFVLTLDRGDHSEGGRVRSIDELDDELEGLPVVQLEEG